MHAGWAFIESRPIHRTATRDWRISTSLAYNRQMPVTIRAFGHRDVDAIAVIHAAAWRLAYRGIVSDAYLDGNLEADRRAAWRTLLAASDFGPGWMAMDGDIPVGFINLRPRIDPTWGTQVDHLHVLPAWHGRGIGRELLHTAAQWCREHTPDAGLFLWVYVENRAARRFYARMGGREVGEGMRTSGEGGQVSGVRVAWEAPAQLSSPAELG